MQTNNQIIEMMRHRDNIMRLVCAETKISPVAIMSKMRNRDVAQARHIIMYALHHKHGYTTMEIGFMLGRTHGSVLHGLNNIANAISINLPYTREIKRIVNYLKNQPT